MAKTNKDLIKELSGYPMKNEIEVIYGEQILLIDKTNRLHIPESKDERGRVVPARNIVQVFVRPKDKSI
jgi:hypothetical protein